MTSWEAYATLLPQLHPAIVQAYYKDNLDCLPKGVVAGEFQGGINEKEWAAKQGRQITAGLQLDPEGRSVFALARHFLTEDSAFTSRALIRVIESDRFDEMYAMVFVDYGFSKSVVPLVQR